MELSAENDRQQVHEPIHSNSSPLFDANYNSDDDSDSKTSPEMPCIKELQLIESLNAVTTHFAHVQFRLRQVIEAPAEEKESLLKDLEEFTFKGIPEIQNMTADTLTRSEQFKDHVIMNLNKQIADLQNSVEQMKTESKLKPLSTVADNKIAALVNKPPAEKHSLLKNDFKNTNLVKKVTSIMHMVNVHCKEEKDNLRRDLLRKKIKCNHWGDARAQLELAISEVIELALEPDMPIDSDYMSDSEGGSFYICNQKLASTVRKKLAPAIQNLIQHGLMTENKSISVRSGITLMIGCVPHINTSSQSSQTAHAWELILKYYKMKNGDQFNSAPALKLSQSFNLDVGTHCATSCAQKLLITIGNIITTHSQYKRSYNSQFKAFVCSGLNAKMLVNWLQLIYRSRTLIEMYYEPWSYALKTGFEDAFKSLERLHHYHFNLPVDVAIHQLQNIKDAF